MRFLRNLTSYIACAVVASCACQAEPVFQAWTPIFHGIEYTSASCEAGQPRPLKIYALRIDLKEKGIGFTTTGRCDQYVVDKHETRKVPSRVFLTSTKTQIAVNGDFYDPFVPQYISGNTNLLHLAISEGVLVSPPNGGASLLISKDNKASIAETDNTTNLKGELSPESGVNCPLPWNVSCSLVIWVSEHLLFCSALNCLYPVSLGLSRPRSARRGSLYYPNGNGHHIWLQNRRNLGSRYSILCPSMFDEHISCSSLCCQYELMSK